MNLTAVATVSAPSAPAAGRQPGIPRRGVRNPDQRPRLSAEIGVDRGRPAVDDAGEHHPDRRHPELPTGRAGRRTGRSRRRAGAEARGRAPGPGSGAEPSSRPPRTNTSAPPPSISRWRRSAMRGGKTYRPQSSAQTSGWCGTSLRTASSGTSSRSRSNRPSSTDSQAKAPAEPFVKPMTPIPSSGATRSSELKPGRIPSWKTRRWPAASAAEEPETHARQPRVRLVVGLEHRRERRGLEDAPVLVGATAEQRRDEAGQVARASSRSRRRRRRSSRDPGRPSRHGARARSPSPAAKRSDRSGRDRCRPCRVARRCARGSSARAACRSRPRRSGRASRSRGCCRRRRSRARRPPAGRRGSTRRATAAALRLPR